MMLGQVLLLLVVLVVVSSVSDWCFTGSRTGVAGDGGVALLLRWGSVVACRWVHG